MNVSVLVSIIAVAVAAGSMMYTRSQALQMKRQFREEGAVLELVNTGILAFGGNNDVPLPLHVSVTLINHGRGRAIIKDITLRTHYAYPSSKRSRAFTDLDRVPYSAGPVPPFELPGLDSVEWHWEVDGQLLRQEIHERRIRTIVPTALLGDGTEVTARPIFVLNKEDQKVWKWMAKAYPVRRRDRTGLLD